MCSQTYNDTIDFRSFGNTIFNRCGINSTFFKLENNYPIYFYEMLLKVNDEYKVIPVTIDNYESQSGTIDYQKGIEEKTFFKRFFLVFNNFTTDMVLYAKNITFNVELENNRDGKSYMKIPYLRIYYHYDEIQNDKLIYFTFTSDYTMDLKRIMKVSLAFLIICIILMVIIVAARMYVWTILNPPQLTKKANTQDSSYYLYFLIHLLFKIFKYYGIIFFFILGDLLLFGLFFINCNIDHLYFFLHFMKFIKNIIKNLI